MGIYISSDGTEKETASLNTFNLVNGFAKAVKEDNTPNIEVLKAELLERLDTRPKEVDGVRPVITVPLSESDLQELQSGEEFEWTFPDQKGELVDVIVRQETEEDNEE